MRADAKTATLLIVRKLEPPGVFFRVLSGIDHRSQLFGLHIHRHTWIWLLLGSASQLLIYRIRSEECPLTN